jgi:hypothetical protein
MDILETICREDLVFLRADALSLGLDDKWLRRGLRDGHLVRVRHGAYTLTDVWNASTAERRHLIRAAAVTRTAKCNGVLSHTTAALCLGADVWDLPLESVHLTRTDRKGGRKEAGVTQHRGLLAPPDITTVDRWRCTTATRTALDITTITDVEHALVVVCSLLCQKLTTVEELATGLGTMTHVPGSLTTGVVLQLADPRLTSVGEARTFHALWREGIPRPEPQYKVRNARDQVIALLDFAWPHLGVWLEFDGKEKYVKYLREDEESADAVFREKKREDRIRRLTGWTCVRITWADLSDPRRIAAKVWQAFEDQRRARMAVG